MTDKILCLSCGFEFTDKYILENYTLEEGESFIFCGGKTESEFSNEDNKDCPNQFHIEAEKWMAKLYRNVRKRYHRLKRERVWAKNKKIDWFLY